MSCTVILSPRRVVLPHTAQHENIQEEARLPFATFLDQGLVTGKRGLSNHVESWVCEARVGEPKPVDVREGYENGWHESLGTARVGGSGV